MTQENLFSTLTNFDYADIKDIETAYLEKLYTPSTSDEQAQNLLQKARNMYQEHFSAEDAESLEDCISDYGDANSTAGFIRGFQAALLMLKHNTIITDKAFGK